jgi:multidrug resistance efflux pump
MAERVHIPERIHRHPAVWWSRVKDRWPFAVWLLAIVAAVFLFFHGGQFGGMSGVVQVVREDVGPLETARLKAIHVTVGQRVKKGDALATMDTTILDTEMAIEKLQIERQFALAVSRGESDLRDLQIRQAESGGELEVLNTEVTRLDELLAKHLIDAQTVANLRARQQALTRAMEFYPEMIKTLEGDLGRMRARQGAIYASLTSDTNIVSELPGELRTEIEAGRNRLGLLDLRRDAYVLRAGADGTVSEFFHEPGDVISAGMPIMTVVIDSVAQVVGFLPEANARDVSVGTIAYLKSTSGRGVIVAAKVAALLPDIATLPTRVSPFPSQVYRGRRVVLVPTEPNDFLPGESVSIELQQPWLSSFFAPRGAKAEGGM